MTAWDIYENRINSYGSTKHQSSYNREYSQLNRKLKDTLSYHIASIDGEDRNVAIVNSDNLNEKTMFSLPGEDFECGGLVNWANNYWLITEKDANNEIYTKVKLLQCNHKLKWIDDLGIIREQWCVIEDGTKYLTGEYEDRNFVVTRGDARIAMTIAKNEHTAKFGRNHRFIIDDEDSEEKNSYLLTKPLKVGKTYNGKGIYSFVLQEVVTTDYDNIKLGIADYYKYFPKERTHTHNVTVDITEKNDSAVDSDRKVWI